MIRNTFFLTVFESYHPYRKLVGEFNARNSIKICEEISLNPQIDCKELRNSERLILGSTTNL